ncbi:hypothetical protein [Vibrio mimicus]|uniref:hypothetical protein n=1 Tax=Vibrio mimicus TaxID=674 RepID=UPI00076B802B|nr:hypothetical protein [Vibrio mimicus]AMG04668.1 hypothetical protein AL543_17540 [Vibrio mimicus]KAA3491827.1 hypothetical protein Y058_14015 [Vibrio mimicus]TXY11492.1 hypothetical protein FXE99_09565 [Vibrio mimicus]
MFDYKSNEPGPMVAYYQQRLEQSKSTIEQMAILELFDLLFQTSHKVEKSQPRKHQSNKPTTQ